MEKSLSKLEPVETVDDPFSGSTGLYKQIAKETLKEDLEIARRLPELKITLTKESPDPVFDPLLINLRRQQGVVQVKTNQVLFGYIHAPLFHVSGTVVDKTADACIVATSNQRVDITNSFPQVYMGGRAIDAKFLLNDRVHDIALLKVPTNDPEKDCSVIPLSDDKAVINEEVVKIGIKSGIRSYSTGETYGLVPKEMKDIYYSSRDKFSGRELNWYSNPGRIEDSGGPILDRFGNMKAMTLHSNADSTLGVPSRFLKENLALLRKNQKVPDVTE